MTFPELDLDGRVALVTGGGSSTTRSARTAAWAGSPRLPTPSAGRLSYTLDSHKRWSRKGGSGHRRRLFRRPIGGGEVTP